MNMQGINWKLDIGDRFKVRGTSGVDEYRLATFSANLKLLGHTRITGNFTVPRLLETRYIGRAPFRTLWEFAFITYRSYRRMGVALDPESEPIGWIKYTFPQGDIALRLLHWQLHPLLPEDHDHLFVTVRSEEWEHTPDLITYQVPFKAVRELETVLSWHERGELEGQAINWTVEASGKWHDGGRMGQR